MEFDIIWPNSIGYFASLYYSWVLKNGCASIFSWRYINMSCLTCRIAFLNAKDAHFLKYKLPPRRLCDLSLLHEVNLQLLFKNCITVLADCCHKLYVALFAGSNCHPSSPSAPGWWLINTTYLSCFNVNLEINQKWSSNQNCKMYVNCYLMIR